MDGTNYWGNEVFPISYKTLPTRRWESRAEWVRFRSWLAPHVKVSVGLLPEPPRCALRARVFGEWKDADVRCAKVALESLPGIYVTGNLFRPAKSARSMPGMLCPHGHWQDGRLHDHDPRGSIIARCYNLAKLGATVFSYDMIGYNDSCQMPHGESFPRDVYWGLNQMAAQTWNSIRALDFLLELPGVDARRIGVTGASGGGTQSFILAAVDDRITASAPICMASSTFHGGCYCENAPLLRVASNNIEIIRLCAPRPQFLGCCVGDWTQLCRFADLPAIRQVYALHGAEGRVKDLLVNDSHNYNREMREAVYAFFLEFFWGRKSAEPAREAEFRRPSMRDRMVWWGREAPAAIPAGQMRQQWIARAEAALKPCLKDAEAARRQLGRLLAHTLVLTEESLAEAAARPPERVRAGGDRGRLVIEARSKAPHPQAKDPFFLTFYRAPAADAVHEILGLAGQRQGRMSLDGRGAAGPWSLLAAAVSDRVASVAADVRGFDPERDADYAARLDVPCIRQVGGMAAILAAIGRRPILLRGATPSMARLARRYAGANLLLAES